MPYDHSPRRWRDEFDMHFLDQPSFIKNVSHSYRSVSAGFLADTLKAR